MGSVGDCYDNAMAESFFATLECELLDRTRFPDPEVAWREIFDFIEGWYNTRRRHSSIGYQSPVGFERQFRETPRVGARVGRLRRQRGRGGVSSPPRRTRHG